MGQGLEKMMLVSMKDHMEGESAEVRTDGLVVKSTESRKSCDLADM